MSRSQPPRPAERRSLSSTRSGVFRILQRGHGERAERKPITGVWGRSPQRGPGAVSYTHLTLPTNREV